MAGRGTPPLIGEHYFYHVLKIRISKSFCEKVYPQSLYDVLCSQGIYLNTNQEEKLKTQKGRFKANLFLLDCLAQKQNWFNGLLTALRDKRIDLAFLAKEFEKEKAYLLDSQDQTTSDYESMQSVSLDMADCPVASRYSSQTRGGSRGDYLNMQSSILPSRTSPSSQEDGYDSIHGQAYECTRDLVDSSPRGAGNDSARGREQDSKSEAFSPKQNDSTASDRKEESWYDYLSLGACERASVGVGLPQLDGFHTLADEAPPRQVMNCDEQSPQQAPPVGYNTVKRSAVHENREGYARLYDEEFYDDAITPQICLNSDSQETKEDLTEVCSLEQENTSPHFGLIFKENFFLKPRPFVQSREAEGTSKYEYSGRLHAEKNKEDKPQLKSKASSPPKEKTYPSTKQTVKQTKEVIDRHGEFDPEIDFMQSSVDNELASMPGYHPGISEEEVEIAIKNKKDGTYLIWYCKGLRKPAITVMYCGSFMTFLIKKRRCHAGMNYYLFKDQKEAFTLKELVDHHLGNGVRYLHRHIVLLQTPVTGIVV